MTTSTRNSIISVSMIESPPVNLDYPTLESLRKNHPAWKLLCADQAPLIASFLHRVFIAPNVRVIDQPTLAEKLEDEIYTLHERLGKNAFPRPAREYLDEWTSPDKGWLRKFYVDGSDDAQFDLTPATEKAIGWLVSLTERSFVGTESRLLTLFDILKQLSEGTEVDQDLRIAELEKRRDEIDVQIRRIREGHLDLLGDTAVKERFQQFVTTARELLSDFRQVEQNFHGLDRSVREVVARWDGHGKGALLERVMGERDAISDSDQGRSFRAFWDFLMSHARQEELSDLLDKVLALPAVVQLQPEPRLKRVHYEWLEAGEHTQRTVAQLSQQLRRFLDDTALLENRRIMDILRTLEKRALDVRDNPPPGDVMEINSAIAEIELPMERPLYAPKIKPKIKVKAVEADEGDVDPFALFSQVVVDKQVLARHIRQSLQERSQITLRQLISSRPLEQGLAELLAYMELATNSFSATIDDSESDMVTWKADSGHIREATMPRVIFTRK